MITALDPLLDKAPLQPAALATASNPEKLRLAWQHRHLLQSGAKLAPLVLVLHESSHYDEGPEGLHTFNIFLVAELLYKS